MNLIKNLYLKYKTNKDENFLIAEGFRKARKQKLQVNIGGEYICEPEEKKGRIYLPPTKRGVDSTKLIALVADDFPDIIIRYIKNRKKLTG